MISSLKLLISSSLVASTPTVIDFSSNILSIFTSSVPLPNTAFLILESIPTLLSISLFEVAFHNAASDKLVLFSKVANNSSLVLKVSLTLS